MFSRTSLDPRVTVLFSIRTGFWSYFNSATASFQHNDFSPISAIDLLQSLSEHPPKLEPNLYFMYYIFCFKCIIQYIHVSKNALDIVMLNLHLNDSYM